MTRAPYLFTILFIFIHCSLVRAQNNYVLQIQPVDKDAAFIASLGLQQYFTDQLACKSYVDSIPVILKARGYITASVDSFFADSASARVVLFVGNIYKWAQLNTAGVPLELLQAVGWRSAAYRGQPVDLLQVADMQKRMLAHLENTGYPFAKIYLDSMVMQGEEVTARLKVNQGPLYTIDSIRVIGNAKVSNDYLQRFLDIRHGSVYSKEKLQRVTARIRELTYVEEEYPPKVVWRSSGAVLDLYLKQKKSSQASLIIGFLPNNDQLSSKKMLVTGEGNLNLKNALGAGETIGINWQQLQVSSQRLNVIYQHPYLFQSPFGLDFGFDMFRKDSTFLNVDIQLGAIYQHSTKQSAKVFVQWFQTILNGIDLDRVVQTKTLPNAADIRTTNLGLLYDFNNTNYRFNPVKGNEIQFIAKAGNRQIKKNNTIMELKDPNDPGFDFESLYDTVKLKNYQFQAKLAAAKYFPVGTKGLSTVKTALNGGFIQSANIFRNELFQVGGYKLLRGFDEESQYLSQYAVATIEYRYLIGQNSFFYAFGDGGWGRNKSTYANVNYTYISGGLGIAFETKVGIFNLAWALGKRNDTEFNLRQSKIHFGFISYF